MRLLSDIRAAQQALVEIADRAPPAADAELPLDAFLAGLRLAWKEGEVRPTARRKATKPRGRRRPDPLKEVTAELEAWFGAEPGVSGRQLLEKLRAAHPDEYPGKLLRTVQRRLRVWRREHAKALVLGPSATGADSRFAGDALQDAGTSRVAEETRAPQINPPATGAPADAAA